MAGKLGGCFLRWKNVGAAHSDLEMREVLLETVLLLGEVGVDDGVARLRQASVLRAEARSGQVSSGQVTVLLGEWRCKNFRCPPQMHAHECSNIKHL